MIRKLNIDGIEVQLENLGPNQGKIVISGYGNNYSTYWGAMGGTIEEFISGISSDYFANRLCENNYDFCSKKTFKNVRDHIRQEIYYLNGWYNHLDFQKDMREKINEFQNSCYSQEDFVNRWNQLISDFDYYLIKDEYERNSIRKDLEGICEPWHFIDQKLSQSYLNLEKLLKKIKKDLKANKGEIFVKKEEKSLVY